MRGFAHTPTALSSRYGVSGTFGFAASAESKVSPRFERYFQACILPVNVGIQTVRIEGIDHDKLFR